MNLEDEFDSAFCHVVYKPEDHIVFLAWKGFCSFDDYRKPATFALELLKKYPGSQFVFDARNGFEDVKEDVEWGFSFLLPEMAKTSCKCVSFILQQVNSIEAEMNMWTKEFGKYFAVRQADDYKEAVQQMKRCLMVDVTYTVKSGKRQAFLEAVAAEGIIKASSEEAGNYLYRYTVPIDDPDKICLLEMWVSDKAQQQHGKTSHYGKLQELKKEYVTATIIDQYDIILKN